MPLPNIQYGQAMKLSEIDEIPEADVYMSAVAAGFTAGLLVGILLTWLVMRRGRSG